MSVRPMISPRVADAVAEARVHLAAAHRLAVLHELEEGIDNHFTVTVPGHGRPYLILPFGLHWSEARASDLIVFDEAGACSRAAKHGRALGAMHPRADPPHHRRARRAAHASDLGLALNMLKDNRLMPASQTAAFFHGHIAYDDDLHRPRGDARGRRAAGRRRWGASRRLHEEPRRARHRRHVAQAYRRLYKLERVCRAQVLAMGTGRPLQVLSDEIVARVQTPSADDRHPRGERERLFFEAMMRMLDRELPGYAE